MVVSPKPYESEFQRSRLRGPIWTNRLFFGGVELFSGTTHLIRNTTTREKEFAGLQWVYSFLLMGWLIITSGHRHLTIFISVVIGFKLIHKLIQLDNALISSVPNVIILLCPNCKHLFPQNTHKKPQQICQIKPPTSQLLALNSVWSLLGLISAAP